MLITIVNNFLARHHPYHCRTMTRVREPLPKQEQARTQSRQMRRKLTSAAPAALVIVRTAIRPRFLIHTLATLRQTKIWRHVSATRPMTQPLLVTGILQTAELFNKASRQFLLLLQTTTLIPNQWRQGQVPHLKAVNFRYHNPYPRILVECQIPT